MTAFTAFSDKDPDDVDAFEWVWTDRLAETTPAETISASVFTTTGDVTIDSDSNTTTTATVVLSGGTAGHSDVQNRITTSGGRRLDQTFRVPVSEQ